MSFSRTRYVTICQQVLVTAAVAAVGITAAGVMTLDIVSPEEAPAAGADLTPAVKVRAGYVDTHPVNPRVREVRVAPPSSPGATARATPRGASRARIDAMPVAVTTGPEPVSGYATVGVTWAPGVHVPENDIAVQVRTRDHGAWSGWQAVPYHDDHGPDATDPEGAHVRPGTDPLVVGAVEAVQMRAATPSGRTPAGLELALIDPGKDSLVKQRPAIDTARLTSAERRGTGTSTGSGTGTSGDIALSAMKVAPKPKIYSRAQWGANEKLREQGPPEYGTIKTGFVHHTVNANHYTAAQVPALIRGIYAYHVVSRGWRDIGYNFLVDRFGRIWEGRYGGVDRPVIGAHTLGYNDVSFAMSAIGNYDIARPPKAVLTAFARLFAWKLSRHGIRADATGLRVHSRVLHAINGHRDVGHTACPGRYLYAKIPWIRTAARKIQVSAQHAVPKGTPHYKPTRKPASAVSQPARTTFRKASDLAGAAAYPDLALLTSTGTMSVLPTGGMVGYRQAVISSGTWPSTTRVVAVGDLTGDGRGDVLANARGQQGWRLYPTDGAGHVSTHPVDSRLRLPSATQVIAAGDWDGDHHADVLTVGSDHDLYLYPGHWNGAGTSSFKKRVLLAHDWTRFTTTVVAGDLDSDRRPDLMAVDRSHVLYRILARSETSLSAPVRSRSLAGFDALLGGGDLTGDGTGDVLVRAAGSGTSWIVRGNGHGGLQTSYGPFSGLHGLTGLSAAQLTGGPRPDVLGRTASGHLVVLGNNDKVNVAAPLSSHLRVGGKHTAVLDVGDWDRDGRFDVVTRHGAHGNTLVLNRGLGGGRFATGILMSEGWRSITRLAPVGDITGDHRPDLVGRTAKGVMEVFPGNGAAGFLRPRRLAGTLRTYNQMAGTRWNPRRYPASALASRDGTFVPYAGAGSASTAFNRHHAVKLASYDWLIGPGDVNGDGHPDLLVRQRSDGSLWLIPGTASGFGPRMFVTGGLGKYRLAG